MVVEPGRVSGRAQIREAYEGFLARKSRQRNRRQGELRPHSHQHMAVVPPVAERPKLRRGTLVRSERGRRGPPQ